MVTNEVKEKHLIMFKNIQRLISMNLQEILNDRKDAPDPYLKSQDIEDAINQMKLFISLGYTAAKTFIKVEKEDFANLDEQEWVYLQRKIENDFNVKINTGIFIMGPEQKTRDKTWWSLKRKGEGTYYYDCFKKYMMKSLPINILSTLDEDTDAIMNNLADPLTPAFSRYGMVVGHVQSGKTSNYAGLICKAADAGYRFIVVIAGGQNNLRNQTQSRLDEVFIGRNNQGVGLLAEFDSGKMPDCLTNPDTDFKVEMLGARQTTNFENAKNPIVVVIKKHTKTLDNLLNWLESQSPKKKIDQPVLVIDDESDYASINTKEENNPTVINKKIRELLQKFTRRVYVAYTATPYANIFIDHQAEKAEVGRDLFPRDFIYALDAPTNYFGANKIFNDEKQNKKHVIEIPKNEAVFELDESIPFEKGEVPFTIKHKKDYAYSLRKVEDLPPSLFEAVRHFIMNVAIRKMRMQNSHNSMLIHISRFTDLHIQIKNIILEYFEELKKHINTYGKMGNAVELSQYIKHMKETYDLHLANDIQESFEDILSNMAEIIQTIKIVDVHQKAKNLLEYRDDIAVNAIVIGGLSLSRGFTLEGLSISYFLRTTMFYDTLMQMGRWFGYRNGYEDLCKVYLTEEMNNNFKFIIQATNDLIDCLKDMKEEGLTPEDFGLAVRTHPDSLLQVTARNKTKHTEELYLEMSLNGHLKETAWLVKNEEKIQENEALLKRTIEVITQGGFMQSEINKSFVWKDVSNSIVQNFVEGYKLPTNDPLGINSRMPIDFIKKYIEEYNGKWDVVLFNGKGESRTLNVGNISIKRQSRTVKEKDHYYEIGNRQVARGNSERILDKDIYKDMNSKQIRKHMEKPLLMLHALTLKVENGGIFECAAFSISFPNQGAQVQTVKMKVNTVYKEQLEKQMNQYEMDSDENDE